MPGPRVIRKHQPVAVAAPTTGKRNATAGPVKSGSAGGNKIVAVSAPVAVKAAGPAAGTPNKRARGSREVSTNTWIVIAVVAVVLLAGNTSTQRLVSDNGRCLIHNAAGTRLMVSKGCKSADSGWKISGMGSAKQISPSSNPNQCLTRSSLDRPVLSPCIKAGRGADKMAMASQQWKFSKGMISTADGRLCVQDSSFLGWFGYAASLSKCNPKTPGQQWSRNFAAGEEGGSGNNKMRRSRAK